jgi:hypothetical protein
MATVNPGDVTGPAAERYRATYNRVTQLTHESAKPADPTIEVASSAVQF